MSDNIKQCVPSSPSKCTYTVFFVDGSVVSKESRCITEASVGVCIYTDDMYSNVLYPWHAIKKIVRETHR